MVGFEPTTQKPMVCLTTPLVKGLEGISPFDYYLKKVNQLPTRTKLGGIYIYTEKKNVHLYSARTASVYAPHCLGGNSNTQRE